MINRLPRLNLGAVSWWLAAALSLTILGLALWTGPIPPVSRLADDIVHSDSWRVLGSDDALSALVAPVAGWAGPDILSTRIAASLGELTGIVASVRLLSLLGVALLLWSVVGFALRMRRSAWLCLVSVPLAWAALRVGGWPHLFGLAALFAGMRAAAVVGNTPSVHGMLRLALIATSGAALSPLDAPLIALGCGWILCSSARRWRALAAAACLAPALAIAWLTGQSLQAEAHAPASLLESLQSIFRVGFDHSLQSADGTLMALLFGAWLVLMASGARVRRAEAAERGDTPPLRGHPVVVLALLFASMHFLVGVASPDRTSRFLVPLIITLTVLPQVDLRRVTKRVALAAVAVISISSSWVLYRAVDIHVHDDVAPLTALIDALPDGKRVACLATSSETFLAGRPLADLCPALVQIRAKGVTPDHARLLGVPSLVQGVPEADWPSLDQPDEWYGYGALDDVDFAIVAGPHRAPQDNIAARLEVARGAYLQSRQWVLYETARPPQTPKTLETSHGGSGGRAMAWDCPAGMALAGMVATTTRDGALVGSVQPRCRAVARAGGRVMYQGRTVLGPRFGGKRQYRRRTMACPRQQLVVGLFGRASDVIDQVGLLCATAAYLPPDPESAGGLEAITFEDTDPTTPSGGEGGTTFGSPCPTGSLITGLRGRYGAAVDAVGVACADLHQVLAAARDPKAATGAPRGLPAPSRFPLPRAPVSRPPRKAPMAKDAGH